MIKNIIKIVFFCIVVCLLGACTDNTFVDGTDEARVEEGIPVSIDLSFQVDNAKIQTRAAQDTRTEYKVNNLYVFAFNGDGTLDAKHLYTLAELTNTSEKDENGTGTTQGTVANFQMHSGNNKTFYAIANVGYSGTEVTDFDNIQTVDDLKNKTMTLETLITYERMGFVMSGQLKDGDKTTFTINGSTYINGTVFLERTDARVRFRVKGEAKNSEWKNFSFEPKGYRVLNIPQTSYIIPREEDAVTKYGCMPQVLAFEGKEEVDGDIYDVFDFYVQENRKQPKCIIDDNAWNQEGVDATRDCGFFALREEWSGYYDSGERMGEKKFIFAPEDATYVEIKGLLSYQDETKDPVEFVSADVTYTIHLGETGTIAEANNRANDYNVKRNTYYTYSVTVKGIDDIVVEVESGDEKRPGAEGDVVIAGGEVLELDAHFDRYKFYLKRSDLLETSADKVLTWAVSTPFENAMRITGSDENMPKDYKWITFAINKEFNTDVSKYVKYPGDDIYDGYLDTPSKFGTYRRPHWTGYKTNSIALRDVEQLLNFLVEEAKDASSNLFGDYCDPETNQWVHDVVVITAFIDEFVYVVNPLDPDGGTPTNPTSEGLLLWKKVVNGRDRMLHICRGKGVSSADGTSSVIRSVLSFKQHPIYTIYDVNQSDEKLKTAWGTESKIETDELAASYKHEHKDLEGKNTPNNGRQNQMNFVTDTKKEWTEIVSTEEQYGLVGEYQSIWHACMLRNRDINGDNIIDANEVRWYLAAIDQLSDLWIGEASINESARLYTRTDGKRYHVASSTYFEGENGSSENPAVIWAEEGASIGSYNDSYYWYNSTGKNYAYRCVRNLGIDLKTPEAEPQDYILWNPQTRTVDLSLLGYASKRSAMVGGSDQLPAHNEREPNNRPYEKFQIASEEYSTYDDGGVSWYKFNERLYPRWGASSSPCPANYRVPNQREMAIMLTIEDCKKVFDSNSSRRYMTVTAFSRDGEKFPVDYSNRPGFLYNSYYGTFILETSDYNKGGTRCVRDVR